MAISRFTAQMARELTYKVTPMTIPKLNDVEEKCYSDCIEKITAASNNGKRGVRFLMLQDDNHLFRRKVLSILKFDGFEINNIYSRNSKNSKDDWLVTVFW